MDTAGCPLLRTVVGDLAPQLDAEGFDLELTGPWPSYSFCDEDTTSHVLDADEPVPPMAEGAR